MGFEMSERGKDDAIEAAAGPKATTLRSEPREIYTKDTCLECGGVTWDPTREGVVHVHRPGCSARSAPRQPAEVTEFGIRLRWRGRRRTLPITWRPHPAAGSKVFPDRGMRVGSAQVPETAVTLSVTITGSFDDGTGRVVAAGAFLEGPPDLDPCDYATFGASLDGTSVDEVVAKLAKLIAGVQSWAERNRP